jgi:NAD+ kinase
MPGGRRGADGAEAGVGSGVDRLRVGVVVNLEKPRAVEVARELVGWLAGRGVEPLVTCEAAEALGWTGAAAPLGSFGADLAFAVVLGGDGTLLAAAKRVAHAGLPLLGVNLGHLGFLTEIEEGELFRELPGLLAGRYHIDERAMLRARVLRRGEAPDGGGQEFLALNDAVVTARPFARLLRVRLVVAGVALPSYAGDGVIVATATGSTAYSLSAGGPVLDPGLRALVVTPICPHAFHARPTVLSGAERVRVEVEPRGAVVVLTLDGQEGRPLADGDVVEVSLAPQVARLLRRPGWSFYRVLRRKLAEGDGSRP